MSDGTMFAPLTHRRLREGDGRMGFAPFEIGLLMELLALTAYACCAAGDDDWG